MATGGTSLSGAKGVVPRLSTPFVPQGRATLLQAERDVSTPGRIRTCDPGIRNPMLYPTELRGQKVVRRRSRLSPYSTRKTVRAASSDLRGGKARTPLAPREGNVTRSVTSTIRNGRWGSACGKGGLAPWRQHFCRFKTTWATEPVPFFREHGASVLTRRESITVILSAAKNLRGPGQILRSLRMTAITMTVIDSPILTRCRMVASLCHPVAFYDRPPATLRALKKRKSATSSLSCNL